MSCGCLTKEARRARKTHGDSESRLYAIWSAMKSRCENPHSKYYDRYGGRGIIVCKEWNQSYEAFKSWSLQNGYSEKLSIDRIDNDGNYDPTNCRWVTGVAQANNRSSNRTYTYNGETHNLTQWAKLLGINPKTVFTRIYSGWSFERALGLN